MKFKTGQKIVVSDWSTEYCGKLSGRHGVIDVVANQCQKYGVRIFGMVNPNQKNGLYWLSEDSIYLDTEAATYNDPIKRVIFNGDKTIVLWTDGTKTIATCGEGDLFDEYAGFCAAVTKKVFGSTSAAKRAMSMASENKRIEKSRETDGSFIGQIFDDVLKALREVSNHA